MLFLEIVLLTWENSCILYTIWSSLIFLTNNRLTIYFDFSTRFVFLGFILLIGKCKQPSKKFKIIVIVISRHFFFSYFDRDHDILYWRLLIIILQVWIFVIFFSWFLCYKYFYNLYYVINDVLLFYMQVLFMMNKL